MREKLTGRDMAVRRARDLAELSAEQYEEQSAGQYERALENLASSREDDEEWDAGSDEEEPEAEEPEVQESGGEDIANLRMYKKYKKPEEAEESGGEDMLPVYARSFAAQDMEQEAVRAAAKLQSLLLAHPDNTETVVEFARSLRRLCGTPGALGWQASAMLEYLSMDYPEEDVIKELAKGWILLSRVVDDMSAVMVNVRLNGLVMLNPGLADMVKDFKGQLDKAE